MVYQNIRLSEARTKAVGRYKSNIYHLQLVNDIMLEQIKSGQYDKEKLLGLANRCIDLGVMAHYLGLSANNYYNRLKDGFLELADTIDSDTKEDNQELIREMTFLLESLKELYNMINIETEGSINEVYNKIYKSLDIKEKASEYLASQERSFYK